MAGENYCNLLRQYGYRHPIKEGEALVWLIIFSLYGVVVFVLGMGVALTVFDHVVMPDLSTLLISAPIVGTFYYLKLGHSAVVFAFFFLFFRFALLRWLDLTLNVLASNLADGFGTMALGFALSSLTWRNFRLTQLQRRRIHEQQAVLKSMAYQD